MTKPFRIMGAGHLTSQGYIRLSQQMAHRAIMEQSLGRKLLEFETVHHKNGDRSDNRLTKGHEINCPSECCNLELWSCSQPRGQRVKDKLAWANRIINMYSNSSIIEEGVAEDIIH